MSIQQLLEQGRDFHTKGNLELAQRKYSRVLKEDPSNAEALHLSGVIAYQLKNPDDAIRLINTALQIQPGNIRFLINLSNVYQDIGDFHRAESILKVITHEDKLNPQAWLNLGNCYRAQKKFDHSFNAYKQAAILNPLYIKAFESLFSLEVERQNYQSAVEFIKEIIKIVGENPELLNNIASCYFKDNCLITALEYVEKALEIDKNNFNTLINKAVILFKQGEIDIAKKSLEELKEKDRNNIIILSTLGNIYIQEKRYLDALKSFEKIKQIDPNNIDNIHSIAETFFHIKDFDKALDIYQQLIKKSNNSKVNFNIGLCYFEKKEFNQAIKFLIDALNLDKTNTEISNKIAESYYNIGDFDNCRNYCHNSLNIDNNNALAMCFIGNSYFLEGNYDLARQFLEHSQTLDKNKETHATYTLSFLDMREGKVEKAFKEGYKLRWQAFKLLQKRPYDFPWWEGQNLKSKTILVWAEQGIGDIVMFASMLHELISRCKECIIEVDKRFVDLFQRSFPAAKIYPQNKQPCPEILANKIDYQVPLGDLAIYFKPRKDYQLHNGYLKPDADLINNIRSEYNNFIGNKPKIGISWCSANIATGNARTIELFQLLPFLKNKDVHFIDVQYGDCTPHIQEIHEKDGVTIFSDKAIDPLMALDKFAAQLASLDLVISVANSTVHLAAAVGTPVWVMIPKAPSWRWMINQADDNDIITNSNYWYPYVKLFKQMPEDENWDRVIKEIALNLENEFALI